MRVRSRLAAATLAVAYLVAGPSGRGGGVCAAAAADAGTTNSPSPPPSWDGTAVVIVDHGSRRAASNAQLDEVVTMYK